VSRYFFDIEEKSSKSNLNFRHYRSFRRMSRDQTDYS